MFVAMRKSIYGICSGIVFEDSLLHRELVQVCVEDRHDLKLRLVIWDASAGVARHDDDQ